MPTGNVVRSKKVHVPIVERNYCIYNFNTKKYLVGLTSIFGAPAIQDTADVNQAMTFTRKDEANTFMYRFRYPGWAVKKVTPE